MDVSRTGWRNLQAISSRNQLRIGRVQAFRAFTCGSDRRTNARTLAPSSQQIPEAVWFTEESCDGGRIGHREAKRLGSLVASSWVCPRLHKERGEQFSFLARPCCETSQTATQQIPGAVWFTEKSCDGGRIGQRTVNLPKRKGWDR